VGIEPQTLVWVIVIAFAALLLMVAAWMDWFD
jgi:hypothetical protein